ncbi:MAG: fused MFS/spermidine synthase [Thermoguttaceae bacterium]|nr:fused MFS/spermidine synthase [Thermoguttaceae bacterium]MDW8036791.1 fused MFS/spermidine synthase [Thermoguttaceae bacterium]
MASMLFALTLLVSAWLLFMVQPMFAKMVLPLLGGAPAVWNTCMVFYQAVLLAGYAYAHWGARTLGLRWQSLLHYVLMLIAWVVLPIGVVAWALPPWEDRPVLWILMVLSVSVGLPFFVLSGLSPMLQSWFALGGRNSRDPYWLYAASNIGSLGGLLAYPFFIESRWTLQQQAWLWSVGYAGLTILIFLCGLWAWRKEKSVQHSSPVGNELPEWNLADSPLKSGQDHPNANPGPLEAAGDLPGLARPDWAERFWWLALAFAPSSLLLGVTTYMTTDLAAVPLLWVIPLALYLLSFVIVFGRWGVRPHRWMVRIHALVVVSVAASYYLVNIRNPTELVLIFALHLGLFFLTALVCHGELAARRPAAQYLTEFYLWMALGGVLGGAFNALVAPKIFPQVYEYPLMIAVACLLRPWPPEGTRRGMTWAWDFGLPLFLLGVYGTLAQLLREHNWLRTLFDYLLPASWQSWIGPGALATATFLGLAAISTLLVVRRPIRFGLAVFGLLIVSLLYCEKRQPPLYAKRSFFGVLRVYQQRDYHPESQEPYLVHQLLHGTTTHGMQGFHPEYREQAWTYYHPTGPVGMIFQAMEGLQTGLPREVGVVGLGTGTLAAYGQPGRHISFFEIDPAVVAIATNPRLFTYLADCQRRDGSVEIVLGDARLQLAKQPQGRFDLLLVDAFSSDAIPLHLLTREALDIYLHCLQPEGILAVHISNRHLDLQPVLANLAADAGLTALVCDDDDESAEGKYRSTWVVLARPCPALEALQQNPSWQPLEPDPTKRLWTDDYSNILDVLNWSWEDFRRVFRHLGS